jgi:predicted nucleotide-binding protein (sugar kinase/HSP70/actin superfamily)
VGSIKIRVETIHYFLQRYAEDLARKSEAALQIEKQLADYERQLRKELEQQEASVQVHLPSDVPAGLSPLGHLGSA